MPTNLYLVVYMDGNWKSYDPLSPPHFSLTLPDAGEIEANFRKALQVMRTSIDGKFVIGAHYGVYCRDVFYQEPLMSLWHQHIANGGEIALHPHEEIVAKRTFFQEKRHMEFVINSAYEILSEAGIRPTAFRGGYNAYSNHITPILESIGVGVDLSALPGLTKPEWDVYWANANTSAYYLCSKDFQHSDCQHPRSKVLEIPMATDGAGADLKMNYLYNEASTLENLCRVWNTVREASTPPGKPTIVHFLCHLHAMGDQGLRDRCVRFLEFASDNGASVVTPSQAKEIYDAHKGDGA